MHAFTSTSPFQNAYRWVFQNRPASDEEKQDRRKIMTQIAANILKGNTLTPDERLCLQIEANDRTLHSPSLAYSAETGIARKSECWNEPRTEITISELAQLILDNP